jgi:hypothetical protein
MLFRTVSETLLTVAEDPRHLGARIGFLAVLHTWGQTLNHHPHLHCLVPGGGISPGGDEWVACRENFLVPVRVLSRLFRRRFLDHLAQAYKTGRLTLEGSLEPLKDPQIWQHLLTGLMATDWVVYAKPPFGAARQVLKYLARYTHRVAISNRRILALTDGRVSFEYTDYAHGRRHRVMSLTAVEFIRRFLMHLLPSGFMHIRYYGLLANRLRQDRLALAKQLLARETTGHTSTSEAPEPASDEAQDTCTGICPACKQGRLILVGILKPDAEMDPPIFDSS